MMKYVTFNVRSTINPNIKDEHSRVVDITYAVFHIIAFESVEFQINFAFSQWCFYHMAPETYCLTDGQIESVGDMEND